ncbi:hypothetical protein [Neobacillus cucumis]|uniref:hypothetical protein n=1 Tax=Neobacillus cucumis TaxID=1740721 RepID=UPI002E1D9687|nr:hypothetical protein [Neobacillus cucumis]
MKHSRVQKEPGPRHGCPHEAFMSTKRASSTVIKHITHPSELNTGGVQRPLIIW